MLYLLCDICDYTVEKFKASTLEKQSTVGSPSNEDHHLSEKKKKKKRICSLCRPSSNAKRNQIPCWKCKCGHSIFL